MIRKLFKRVYVQLHVLRSLYEPRGPLFQGCEQVGWTCCLVPVLLLPPPPHTHRHAIVASDKVPLGTFHRALAAVGVHDYDMDEVECLLGHCIAQVMRVVLLVRGAPLPPASPISPPPPFCHASLSPPCLPTVVGVAQGNIKGYASHAMRTLVFSKEDAFPKLS